MFGSRIFQVLLVALGVLALAQAVWMGADRIPDAAKRGIVMKRQTAGSVTGNAEPSDTPSPTTPTSPSPTDEPTDDPTTDPTPTENPDTETTTPPKTTAGPTTSTKPDETSDPTTAQETNTEPTTETTTQIIMTTNSDGVVSSFTTESTTTRTPGLSADKSSGSSGMSKSTRNTVIGVVVGVGGAIVLGALGFVAWRIWGRKKQADDNDGLMNYNTGYAPMDKSEAGSSAGGNQTAARNPFQSTLETYHAPTQVNASSNF